MNPEKVRSVYQQLLSSSILPELGPGSYLARLLYNPRLRTWLFRRHGQQLAEAMTDIITGKQTYRGLFTDPKNYLKAVGLKRAG